MAVARFYCVHCNAPLKTSAELTPDKRIQCPRCDTIFPVPAHLLRGALSPTGTMPLGPDLTTGAGVESPRAQLVDMEGILGPADTESAATPPPARSPVPEAPAQLPTPPTPRALAEPEPWETELEPDSMPRPSEEGEATQDLAGQPADEDTGKSGREPELIHTSEEEQWAAAEAAGEEAPSEDFGGGDVVAESEPEVVDFGEEEAPKKSSLWIWVILLALLLVLAGGIGLAWYMGWLDPVLQMLGLAALPSPSNVVKPNNPSVNQNLSPGTDATSNPSPPVDNSKPTAPTAPNAKPGPVPAAGDVFAALEKVFSEVPARPIADMHSWRYVPADANLVLCLNLGNTTQHPAARQLVPSIVEKAPLPLKPEQRSPFDVADIAEIVACFTVDWANLSADAVGNSFVGIIRLHKPVDENQLRTALAANARNVREEKIGERVVFFGTDDRGNQLFSCQLAPEVLVGGVEGREKAVPGLVGTAPSGLPEQWALVARGAGNAHVAVLVRDVSMSEILKTLGAIPPEVQPYVPALEKMRHASLKVELTPKTVEARARVVLADEDASKQLASLLQKLYDEQFKPGLSQLAGFAPELAQDLQKSLRITADRESTQIEAGASYPALGKAVQAVAALLGPALLGKPKPE
ncbi:MAG: hypothetical protein RMJ19_06845 [Gemmatales bacterium]|nr:hypothetical protein [Gemmatales bacterium]MDW8175372.1 hypothetical protein [Gemmatales bacterium]